MKRGGVIVPAITPIDGRDGVDSEAFARLLAQRGWVRCCKDISGAVVSPLEAAPGPQRERIVARGPVSR